MRRMHVMRSVALVGIMSMLAMVADGCAGARKPLTVPLRFGPKTSIDLNGFSGVLTHSEDLKVFIKPFDDNRPNKNQIGENTDKPANPIPIYSSGQEPAELVHDVLTKQLQMSGIAIVDKQQDANRIVSADLTQFWVNQASLYHADVRAVVTVENTDGKTLWRGPVSGSEEVFGLGMKADNFQEAYSGAIVKMIEGLLNNRGFQKSLSTAQPAAK